MLGALTYVLVLALDAVLSRPTECLLSLFLCHNQRFEERPFASLYNDA